MADGFNVGVNPRVVVVGGGLVGTSAALAIADAGGKVELLTRPHAGAASEAAAGMLAPSMELARTDISEIAIAARDMFPDFVRQLGERSGIRIELSRAGLLQLAADDPDAATLAGRARGRARWLDSEEMTRVEPQLVAAHGGALWPHDGAVNNTQLLAALHAVLLHHDNVVVRHAAATAIATTAAGITVLTDDGMRVPGTHVVVAAGAWSGQLEGARFATAVEPVRGQLVEFDREFVTHVVYGPDCYLVPRAGCTIAGSTMERVGFDAGTTDEAVRRLTASAIALCPSLSGARTRSWGGLRPVTPDLLPLLGPDPANPAVIYACGHSRNGVLLAPLTAVLIRQLIFEERLTFEIHRFRPERFADTFTVT